MSDVLLGPGPITKSPPTGDADGILAAKPPAAVSPADILLRPPNDEPSPVRMTLSDMAYFEVLKDVSEDPEAEAERQRFAMFLAEELNIGARMALDNLEIAEQTYYDTAEKPRLGFLKAWVEGAKNGYKEVELAGIVNAARVARNRGDEKKASELLQLAHEKQKEMTAKADFEMTGAASIAYGLSEILIGQKGGQIAARKPESYLSTPADALERGNERYLNALGWLKSLVVRTDDEGKLHGLTPRQYVEAIGEGVRLAHEEATRTSAGPYQAGLIEGGHSYLQMEDAGVPHEIAEKKTLLVEVVNGALESAGDLLIVAPIAGAVTRLGKRFAGRVLTDQTMKMVLAKTLAKETGMSVLRGTAEVATEIGQEWWQAEMNNLAIDLTNELEHYNIPEERKLDIGEQLWGLLQESGRDIFLTGFVPIPFQMAKTIRGYGGAVDQARVQTEADYEASRTPATDAQMQAAAEAISRMPEQEVPAPQAEGSATQVRPAEAAAQDKRRADLTRQVEILEGQVSDTREILDLLRSDPEKLEVKPAEVATEIQNAEDLLKETETRRQEVLFQLGEKPQLTREEVGEKLRRFMQNPPQRELDMAMVVMDSLAAGKGISTEEYANKVFAPEVLGGPAMEGMAAQLDQPGVELPAGTGQPVSTIDEVYAQAEESLPEFKATMEWLAEETGGVLLMREGLKDKARAEEKTAGDKGGDAGQLLDVLAGTLAFDTEAEAVAAADRVGELTTHTPIKNYFDRPTALGYRGIGVNVQLGTGHVTELQLSTKRMLVAKEGLGHLIYEVWRKVDAGLGKLAEEMESQGSSDDEIAHAVGRIEDARSELGAFSQQYYERVRAAESLSRAMAIASSSEMTGPFEQMTAALSGFLKRESDPSGSILKSLANEISRLYETPSYTKYLNLGFSTSDSTTSIGRPEGEVQQAPRNTDTLYQQQPRPVEGTGNRELNERMVATYSTTKSGHAGGYILSDGRMVDLAGGEAVRTLEHADVAQALGYSQTREATALGAEEGVLRMLQETGAVRWGGSYGDFRSQEAIVHFVSKPTGQQIEAILDGMESMGVEDLYVEWSNVEGDTLAWKAFKNPEAKDIQRFVNDPRRFASQESMLYQSPKAAISFKEDGQALLHATEATDLSSFIHEVPGHLARRHLKLEHRAVLEGVYGVKDGAWTREQEERFADDVTTYLMEGAHPSPRLAEVFRKIAEVLKRIYNAVRRELDPKVRAVLDEVFAEPDSAFEFTMAEQAREFESADEFVNYMANMVLPMPSEEEQSWLSQGVEAEQGVDQWLRDFWEQANRKTLEESNQEWLDSLTREGVQEHLSHFMEGERGREKRDRLRTMHPTIASAIRKVQGAGTRPEGRALKESHWKQMLGMFKKDPTGWREWFTEDDEALREIDRQKTEAGYYEPSAEPVPKVQPRKERIDLAQDIEDPKERRRILEGKDTGRRILRDIADLSAELKKSDTRVAELRGQVRELSDQLKKQKVDQRKEATAKRRAAVELAVKKERARKQELLQKARDKKKLREYMLKLGKRATRTISTASTSLREVQLAEDLQDLIDPKFRAQKTLDWREARREYFKDHPEDYEKARDRRIREIHKKALNEYTVKELEDITAEIDRLAKMGRLRYRLEKGQIEEYHKGLVDRVIEGIWRGEEPPSDGGGGESNIVPPPGEKIKKGWGAAVTWVTRPWAELQMLDGGTGAIKDLFWDRVNAMENERIRQERWSRKAYFDKVRTLGLDPKKLSSPRLSHRRDIDGYDFTTGELIGIWAVWMNDRHCDALAAGGVSRPMGQGFVLINQEMYEAIDKELTAKEKELGEWVRDEFDRRYPALREAYITLTNKELGKERFYLPIVRVDPGSEDFMRQMEDELLHREGYRKASVRRGHTIPRKQIADENQTPIRIDIQQLFLEKMPQHEHYIAYAKLIRDINHVVNNREVQQAIQQKYGKHHVDWLKEYAEALARPDLLQVLDHGDKVFRFLRRHQALAFLAFRAPGMLKQTISVFRYMAEGVTPVDILRSAAEFMQHPLEMYQFVSERDPQVAERAIDVGMEQFKESGKGLYTQTQNKVARVGMKGYRFMDAVAIAIGWKARFNQVMKETSPSGRLLDGDEAQAIKAAQDATLRTQPQARPKDLPTLYRSKGRAGGLWQWLTMFTNQLNQDFNILAHGIPQMVRERKWKHVLGTVTSFAISGVVFGMIGRRRLPKAGEIPEDFLKGLINTIPLFGNELIAGWEGWIQRQEIAFFEAPQALMKLARDIVDGREAGASLDMMARGVSALMGLPYLAVKKIVETGTEKDLRIFLLGGKPKE